MFGIRALALPAVLAGAALVSAACGAGGSGYGRPASATTATSSATSAPDGAAATTVAVTGSPLGPLIVDASGRALYLFEADTSATSTCYDACAQAWPPLLTAGTPDAGPNVNGPDLATSTRRDGTVQVTYHGHPLYRFVGDRQAGDTTGQGLTAFGARWYLLDGNGTEITRT